MLSVFISGVDRSSYVAAKSIKISDVVNESSDASLTLRDVGGTYRPQVGEPVEIINTYFYDELTWSDVESFSWAEIEFNTWADIESGVVKTLVFAGTIDDLPEEKKQGSSMLEYFNIPLIDYHQTAGRKIVAEVYENISAGSIVTDIFEKYLEEEGIAIGIVQDGQTIIKAVFNYMTAAQCFDELSELTGYQWRLNADKSLDFFDRSTFTGTPITEASSIENLKVKKSRDQYRNRQYLRAGNDISTTQTRTFKGDGETSVFPIDLPIALEPTISVNGTPKTVGIRGVEIGKDFYWQKNDKTISQDDSTVKLTSSQILSVEFRGYIPIMVLSENLTEIESRQGIEGGTGIYESVEEKTSIDTREAAFSYNDGLLRRYSSIKSSVTFETYLKYRSGQLVSVSSPSHNIYENMLVSDVAITDIGAADSRLKYSVTLVSGEAFGGWTRFFKKLTEKSSTFTIRENEVLVKFTSMRDEIILPRIEDEMTYNLHQYKICGTFVCGEDAIL